MANPLRWFRRHAKILMVVLGSAAMAIFGLGPVFDAISKPPVENPREREVIATWNGGEITRNDLDAMQIRHFQTQRFLRELYEQAAAKKGDQYRPLVAAISPIREGQRFDQKLVDQQLIDRYIMARKAEKEGIIVSDGVIDDYLALSAANAGFSETDLIQINKKANQGGCSLENVKRHLRIELLAQQMARYAFTGLPFYPNPSESMELHGRVSERIECQVLPVSVEQYVSKIDEKPGEAELKELYEEGKYDFADPTGKKPGFKLPDKVRVQYLVGEFETFVQNEINKLTDEEVQKRYEELVAEKSDLVMETIPDESADTIQIEDPPPILPGEENITDDADADGVDPPPTSSEPETEAADDDVDSSADIQGADDDQSTDDEETTGDGQSTDDDQSRNVSASKSQFVSLSQQEDAEDAESPAQQDAATGDDNTLENDSESPSASDASGEEMVQPESEDSSAQSDEQIQSDDVVQPETSAEEFGPLMTPDEKQEIKKRVLPLKDVADQVKRSMVAEKAQLAMDEAVKKANVVVSTHHTLRMKWEYTRESERGPAPEPLDFQAIADKYNLVANETDLVDAVGLSEERVGRIAEPVAVRLPNGQQQRQIRMVAELLFSRFADIKLYDPQTAVDFMTSDTFLYWLSEKVEARTPEFDECRPAVEKFWTNQKGFELALAEAQKIAEEANRENRPLSELYPERASETGEFTWFSSFGGAGLGNPVGVSQPSEEFMEAAFSLEKLQAAAAPNLAKDTIYVVQKTSDKKTVEAIGDDYLDNQFFKFKRTSPDVQNVANVYGQEMRFEWNRELADEMGLKYIGL